MGGSHLCLGTLSICLILPVSAFIAVVFISPHGFFTAFFTCIQLNTIIFFLRLEKMSFNTSVSTFNPLDTDGGVSRYLISCGDLKCSHGKCVLVNGQPTCECKLGYTGNICSDTINEAVSIPLTLGVLAFIVGFIILIFGLAFIRQKQKAKQRSKTAEEALRQNGVHL